MTKAGDMAFPLACNGVIAGGLTKRECFAAFILQGLSANPFVTEKIAASKLTGPLATELIMKMAVATADALIAALNEEAK